MLSCVRVLLLVTLSVSTVVYWQGILNAYPIPSKLAVKGPTNSGQSFPSTYSPITEPQPQVTTLFQEYSLLDPYYVNEPNRVIFHTSFGDYAFNKNQPTMSFTYRDSTPLIRNSVFNVNSTLTPIVPRNYTIDMASLSNNHLAYSVRLQSGSAQVGTMHVAILFDRIQRPKITITVQPSPRLTSAGFNVIWIVRGYGSVARFKNSPAGFDFTNATLTPHGGVDFVNVTRVAPQVVNDSQFDLGPSGLPATWRVWAKVDWSDARTAKLGFGRLPIIQELNGPSAVVAFPRNLTVIDPTIVGQSSSAYASSYSYQRRVYFDGSDYWSFYFDGSNTVYKYSMDGRSWSGSSSTLWSYPYTALWFSGNNVYALAGTSASAYPWTAYLFFRKGMINGNGISWNSVVTVDSYTYSPSAGGPAASAYRDVNLVIGSDGLITVIFTKADSDSSFESLCAPPFSSFASGLSVEQQSFNPNSLGVSGCHRVYYYSSDRWLQVKKSANVGGTSWGTATTILSQSDSTGHSAWSNRYLPILSQLPGGSVLGIYNDVGAIKYSKSSSWTSVSTLDGSGKYIEEFGSAVADSSGKVNFVYVYSDSTIKYAYYNATASSWTNSGTLVTGSNRSPTITLGYGNDLELFYIDSGNVIRYLHYSSLSGWGSPTAPFGTTFTSPAALTSISNSTSGFLIGIWTEGTASPYSVKLGSLPIEAVWSPYSVSSKPWDSMGLIPYGHYYRNLQEYVSPYNGLLTLIQTDFDLPSRGEGQVGDLMLTRVFRTPYAFLGTTPFNYESYPYVNLGLGWSFSWPWLGSDYLHLWNGQGYKITWTSNVFENHLGDNFKLIKNANSTYSLYDASGMLYTFDSNRRLTYILDQNGNEVTFAYSSNQISAITDSTGQRTVSFAYDGNGRLSAINSGGRIWTYGYNANGNLISVVDPLGRTTSYQYDQANAYLLTKITYPTAAYSTYTYQQFPIGTETTSSRVNVQATKLSDGTLVRQTNYVYTVGAADRVNLTTLRTYNGTQTTQGYNIYDFTDPTKVTHKTLTQSNVTMRKTIDQYNSVGEINNQTIFLGNSASKHSNLFNYDNWGNTVFERTYSSTNTYREVFYSYANTNSQNHFVNFSGSNVTYFSNQFYSAALNGNIHDKLVGQAENQMGSQNKIETYYKYGSTGNLFEQKNRLGSSTWLTTDFTYDSYGNPATRTDAKGNQTTYEYSSTYYGAYLTKVSSVVGGVTLSNQYAYNFTTGDKITVTSPSGNATDYRYDDLGRLYKVQYPTITGTRAQKSVTYDDVNNIATVIDENGNYAKYYYDGLARLTKTETYANGTVYSTATNTYYWNDKLKTYTDQTGNVTTYTHDFLGRTASLIHPDGTAKTWSYDDVNVKVTAYDERNHPTDYSYDWRQRLVQVTEHLNSQSYNTLYTYDSAGNLLQTKDALNQITSYTYDNLNRQISTTFPDTTYQNRTYDQVGNLVTLRTQNNTMIYYSYDQINRLTQITYPDATTVIYAYDKDSHRIQMIDSTSTTGYSYDARGRLLTETRTIDGQNYPLTYQYDPASNLIQLTYPDGYQLQYTYDQLNRIRTAGNLAALTYRKDNTVASITYGNGVQTGYSYDRLGRTSRILTRNSTSTLLDLNYAYDANGNLLTLNTNQETYSYDDLNRLTNANGPWGSLTYSYDMVGNRLSESVNGTATTYTLGSYNKLSSAGAVSFTYDANGNRLTATNGSNVWNYEYDYENRLRQVQLNGQQVFQAWYDGDGRRARTVASATATIYHYLPGSWDPVYVKDTGSGVVTDLVFAGALLIGKVQSGVNYYYHPNNLGSVRLVTNNLASSAFVTNYKPFGTSYGTSGNPERFTFTGKQNDVSTGLYYYGYRYYDPQVGRFLTPDNYPPELAQPQSLNQYTYVQNNPTINRDPDGHNKTGDAPNAVKRDTQEAQKAGSSSSTHETKSSGGKSGGKGGAHEHTKEKTQNAAQIEYAPGFIGPAPQAPESVPITPPLRPWTPGQACVVNAVEDYLNRVVGGVIELALGVSEVYNGQPGGANDVASGVWDIFMAGWDTGGDYPCPLLPG